MKMSSKIFLESDVPSPEAVLVGPLDANHIRRGIGEGHAREDEIICAVVDLVVVEKQGIDHKVGHQPSGTYG